MQYFLRYWFIEVPKLTKFQAFELFYRFVRYVAGTKENSHRGSSFDEFMEEMETIELDEADSKRFAEALANPPEPCEALKELARKTVADSKEILDALEEDNE